MSHVDDVDPLARRVGAINTHRRSRRPLDWGEHRRRRLPRAASGSHRGARARARRSSARAARPAASRSRSADQGAAVTICARETRRSARDRRPRRRARRRPSRRSREAGTCSSTRRRPALGQPGRTRLPAPSSTARWCSTSCTRRPRRRLLADARAAGCLTIGGLEMLVAQAERQFELWTGQRPPVGLFDRAAKAAGKAAEAATTGIANGTQR